MGRITRDGVSLTGFTSTPETPSDLAIVLAHGFSNHVWTVPIQRIAARLARRFGIVALSFRGHRGSSGRTSVGPAEVRDIAAAVELARELGYAKVATVGFSMGAAVSLLHASQGVDVVDATVSVSSPSRWYVRQTAAMRRVHWLIEAPHARLLAPMLGVRVEQPWALLPVSPIEVVHRIETPLLVVHGDRDHYFPAEHGEALHRASGRSELWLEHGMAHAESAVTPGLADRIGDWLNRTGGRTSHEETSTRAVA